MLAYFINLRVDDILAITHFFVSIVKRMVFFFSTVKGFQRFYFGYYWFVKNFIFFQPGNISFGNFLLLFRIIKIALLYCVPTSLPCLFNVVGSCVVKIPLAILYSVSLLGHIQTVLPQHDW